MPRARSRRSSSVDRGLRLQRRRSISPAFPGSRRPSCASELELHVERDELLLRPRRGCSARACVAPRPARRRAAAATPAAPRSGGRSAAPGRPARRGRATSRSFAGFIGSFAGIVTESAPSTSPRWSTSTASAAHAEACLDASAGHVGGQAWSSAPTPQPHGRRVGARRLAEHGRHARQHVVRVVRLADPLGELRQHLVRASPPPYTSRSAMRFASAIERDRPSSPYASAEEHERQQAMSVEGRARCRCRRARRRPPPIATTSGHDDREHHGLLDHEVEVVQAEPEDRDRGRRRDAHHDRDHEQHHRARSVAAAASPVSRLPLAMPATSSQQERAPRRPVRRCRANGSAVGPPGPRRVPARSTTPARRKRSTTSSTPAAASSALKIGSRGSIPTGFVTIDALDPVPSDRAAVRSRRPSPGATTT